MKNLLTKLKKLLNQKESTFISHRYLRFESRYSKIYNYLYKKQNRLYNKYIDLRAFVHDSPNIIKLRAFMFDLFLTWVVYSIVLLCITYYLDRLSLSRDVILALGIAVLVPVVQYYIRWYFQIKVKPFKDN